MDRAINKSAGILQLSKVLADALRMRDAYTRLHSDRVMMLARGIGLDIGLTNEELSALELGSCLHDIGKIVVPDRVLMKPSKLDAEELGLMQLHPVVGGDMVAAYEHPNAALVGKIIRHHHEWFDGNGYPDRLSGQAIPLLSRIVTVVDSYDAMAVRRVYQGARHHDEILEIMAGEAGSKLDPEMLDRLLSVLSKPDYSVYKAH